MAEDPTEETRRLAAEVLNALLEWDPTILEPMRKNMIPPDPRPDRERWWLARQVSSFLSDDARESAAAWATLLRWFEPEPNISDPAGPPAEVRPMGVQAVEARLRVELRALEGGT